MAETDLTTLPGVGDSTAEKLRAAGYETVEDVKSARARDLTEIEGVGMASALDLVNGGPDEAIVEPPSGIRGDIILFYKDHEDIYRSAWSRLEQTRRTYETMPPGDQIKLLQASYINAVISQQTQVELHENAWQMFLDGTPLRDAMFEAGVQHYDQKSYDWIHPSLEREHVWKTARQQLEDGLVDAAHDTLVSGIEGLGHAKAPFTLANLGFTQKMCIDTNVGQLFKAEFPKNIDVGFYEGVCREIQDFFPQLSSELQPYELQWLVFDFMRVHNVTLPNGGDEIRVVRNSQKIAQHDMWFKSVSANLNDTLRAVEDERLRAMGVENPADPDADDIAAICDEIEAEIYESLGHDMFMEAYRAEVRDAMHDAIHAGLEGVGD